MGTIINYLDKYSNKSFGEMPFNNVDNLILCALSYLQLENIIPPDNSQFISVKDAALIFYKNKEILSLPPVQQVLYKMATGKRFADAKLSNYVNLFDNERILQFCALHIGLSDNTTFIAIRGTDDSITGWYESFCISYKVIPSQIAALDYINSTMKQNRTYRIGGHSKGGNLAQYAALMCRPKLQQQIVNIFCNDAPGLVKDFTAPDNYQAISDKIIRIVPEFSIIGSFFEKEEPTLIVKSTKKGIVSHDALTWCVENEHFLTTNNITFKSRLYSALCRKLINSLNFSQRKKIIDYCFLAIRKSDIDDMTKLNAKILIKLLCSRHSGTLKFD